MKQNSVIGTPAERVDALSKVKGTARFCDDIRFPNMVYGKLCHSPFSHAKILSISTEKALAVPGVIDVILADDLHKNKDIGEETSWLLARDEVCYIGDRVALVVGETEEAAEAGAKAVEVEYEELPAVLELTAGAAPDSPLARTDKKSNIYTVLDFTRGDVDAEFAGADVVVEGHFVFPTVHQVHLEPNSATATYIDGKLTVYCGSQAWFRLRHDLSDLCGLEESRIAIKPMTMGGAFGARSEQATPVLASVIAMKTGRPAKFTNTREEEFYNAHPAVEFQTDMSIAADKEGHLLAQKVHFYTDIGAYDVAGESVTWVASTRAAAVYQFKATHTVGECVYTNRCPTAAYRGYGNPQAHLAMESLVDMVAEKLHMDPTEVRLRNYVTPDMTSHNGYRINSNGIAECMRRAKELSGWDEKFGKLPPNKGIGVSSLIHASGSRAGAKEFSGGSAVMRAELSGVVSVYVGEAEIGQGSKTVMAQIAAQELGLKPRDITVVMGDTELCPFSTGTNGSKLTSVLGNAVMFAAKQMAAELCESISSVYGVGGVYLEDGLVKRQNGETLATFREALYACCIKRSGRAFVTEGTFEPDADLMDDNGYGNVASSYPFGVHIAEITVEKTGKVKIDRITAVHDSGRIINPQMALGQVYGGVTQACGFSAMEQNGRNEFGILTAGTLLEYKIPTTLDVPEIVGSFVECTEPNGPYGAKALGEPPIIGVAGAVANAYCNATGQRLTEIPFTPQKVLKAQREKSFADKKAGKE